MRLNQFISSSGFCSRRQADKLIKSGRVTVNAKQVSLLYMTCARDVIKVDDQIIKQKKHDIYIILNKPAGITCTSAKNIEGNIIDFVGYPERIFPVGRLDKQSTGLILLTNDGDIVNDLLKVESDVEKDYEVTVNHTITESFLDHLRNGVSIYNPRIKDHTVTKACKVVEINKNQFLMTLSQGLNRQIRRMCRRYQYTVTELKRVRIKNIVLGDLPEGKWRFLTTEEVKAIKAN